MEHKTHTHNSGGKNPVWNDSMTFNIRGETQIYFKIFDKDHCSSDDFVAECTIPLYEIFEKKNDSSWHKCTRKGKDGGMIMVQFEWLVQFFKLRAID